VPADEPAVRGGIRILAPPLVTLHVWLWYHNPSGIYSGTNPLVAPFNGA
jgi:hypothetical protein